MEKMTLYVVVLAMFKITVIMPIPSNVGTVFGSLGTHRIIL